MTPSVTDEKSPLGLNPLLGNSLLFTLLPLDVLIISYCIGPTQFACEELFFPLL